MPGPGRGAGPRSSEASSPRAAPAPTRVATSTARPAVLRIGAPPYASRDENEPVQRLAALRTGAAGDERQDVRDAGDGAELRVGRAVLARGDLVQPRADHDRDQHEAGEGARAQVDHRPALVTAWPAEPAQRLAARGAEGEQRGHGR